MAASHRDVGLTEPPGLAHLLIYVRRFVPAEVAVARLVFTLATNANGEAFVDANWPLLRHSLERGSERFVVPTCRMFWGQADGWDRC